MAASLTSFNNHATAEVLIPPSVNNSVLANRIEANLNQLDLNHKEILKSPGLHESMSEQKITQANKFWDMAKKYAGIIDSRESITRLVLDLTAFDIPVIMAGATRNWSSFLEACVEAGWSTLALFIAPPVTKFMAKVAAMFHLGKDEQKHSDKLARLYRSELHSEEEFKAGVHRVLDEEPKDLDRIANIYSSINKPAKAEAYKNESSELKNYFKNLNFNSDQLKSLSKFKESIVVLESAFEGLIWGGFGLALRWFRKNILKEGRFTGTKAYLNDKDSKKLGQAGELSGMQKIFGRFAVVLSPILNFTMMKLCRNRELVKNNKVLNVIDKSLDMTHGLFPKLGLLFSYTTIPKWFGAFSTVQGMDELIERMIKFCTLIPSWWLGHRLANGGLAAYFDKKLVNEFGVKPGVLLEPAYVGKFAPDPAKIHHVLETTKHDTKLQEKAKDYHAITLYAGIGLHSLGVFLVTLMANQFTKWRVQAKKANLKPE